MKMENEKGIYFKFDKPFGDVAMYISKGAREELIRLLVDEVRNRKEKERATATKKKRGRINVYGTVAGLLGFKDPLVTGKTLVCHFYKGMSRGDKERVLPHVTNETTAKLLELCSTYSPEQTRSIVEADYRKADSFFKKTLEAL